MNYLTRMGRALDIVNRAFSFLAALLLVFILLSVCLEVFMRYFLNRPLQWVVELTEYTLLFITFLGAAWLLHRGGHISVDVVVNRLSSRTQARLRVLSCAIGILICGVLAWYGTDVAWDHYQRKIYNITLMEVPKAPLLAIIPVGCLVLLLEFIRQCYRAIRALRDGDFGEPN
jgi:C4-dicarboxylate transporter DctQ subunit